MKKLLLRFLLPVLLCLLVAEGFLRLQQAVGPLLDLEFRYQMGTAFSDELNHVPLLEIKETLGGKNTYGDQAGLTYVRRYDAEGIRINSLRPPCALDGKAVRILFLGDSFLQGYDDAHTIDQLLWSWLRKSNLKEPLCLFNAGCGSYSPAIYVPQAKRLIPKLQPDLVVILLNPTDLGDDFIRYKHLVVRDPQGHIQAVQPTPLHVELDAGLERIRANPVYVARLVQMIWFFNVYFPAFEKGYRSYDPREPVTFAADKEREGEKKYAAEIKFFESNVAELAETTAYLLKDKKRVLIVYHPLLEHLQPDAEGKCWNNLAATAIAKATRQQDVVFYDATEDLKKAFGDKPADYYWHGDMHFNFEGFRIFSELVAQRLRPMIEAAAKEKSEPAGQP